MNKEEDEIEPAPLICPYCEHEFDYVEGQSEYTCQNCGRGIGNMQAQFAYSRGYDAFFAGQRAYMEIPPSRRSRLTYAKQAQDVTQLYIEAYTAIQEAFQSTLAQSQSEKAIEMMATISIMFTQTNLVSPMESGYWTALVVEQVNHKEYDELNGKLSIPPAGILNRLARLRWRLRQRQLRKALLRVEQRIKLLEQNIAFISPPKIRKEAVRRSGVDHV